MGLFNLFKKDKINTAPENDTERWILGTYAMWSMYYDSDWKHIAGAAEVDRKNRASMHLMLRRDWGISTKEELFDTANQLRMLYMDDAAAWDLCRACQILGMGFIANMITREEMVQHSVLVCLEMQELFQSWDELYESYLKGYRDWQNEQGENTKEINEAIRARENICRKLKEDPNGPWAMEWRHKF